MKVLLWGSTFIFFERFYEITQVIETGIVGDFCNGMIGCQKIVAGAFNPVIIEIIHGVRCVIS